MLKFEQHRTLQVDDWIKDNYKGHVVYSFKGSITAEEVSNCIETLEFYLNTHSNLLTKPKTAINIAIELIQNIYHHAMQYYGVEKFGAVKMVHLPKGLQMEFLNVLIKDKAIILNERIQQLNVLSKNELKKLHLLILSNNEYSKKGGGGLGLVDVAKKLNTKLIAEFYPFEKNNYIYLLKIYLT